MVRVPRFYGIILRRGQRSRVCQDRLHALRATLDEEMREDRSLFDQDADLISFSAGMSPGDASIDVERLKAEGMVEGVDFCVTARLGRSISALPGWLDPVADEGCVSLIAP